VENVEVCNFQVLCFRYNGDLGPIAEVHIEIEAAKIEAIYPIDFFGRGLSIISSVKQ
jgi:hypothetical protein